jgi:hypothetical protein
VSKRSEDRDRGVLRHRSLTVAAPWAVNRFMERLDGKAVLTHEDHEPMRNGRARSPLRAADAVNDASSRGAHGVTRPTGNGRCMETIDGKAVLTHEDHEPLRSGRARSPLRAADAVNDASSRGTHGVTRPSGNGWCMETIDGKAVLTHEDHEPTRNGRARSPLRAADAVNDASRRGAHGVTRPSGNGRFMERLDGKGVVTHEDHEPMRNGRARSPLRAADAVNDASRRGAHGVTRRTGNGRFRERALTTNGPS